ncbi:zinc finger CCCH domain-containing protein 32-like isoform X1 [Hibiscus syriacus]|uniref:zinc finger CCCH domain-containing protein 32-like isoform X1 n=1 Tax=Hibiscus syriacus TaxID=106335 RepID=UPI001921E2D3|nr:zinc finger CCCH domain-containing protein 32-like isoform X1 [Hibiscus syriacus]
MELYGRIPTRNGSQSVHRPEWSPAGPGTGLEESMWQMSSRGTESYPERPGVPDCVYYMRTGLCGYGSRCRYNHPQNRAAVEAAVRATGEYPERPGEPACQFYLKTGTCKFGASCKFHHPKNGGGSFSHVPLNIYGYPLRPGEEECSYYLKMGQCKFGVTCKFHHPQPAGTSMPASAPQFYQSVQSPSVPMPEQYGGASTSVRVARPPLMPGSYVQGAYGPVLFSPGVVPIPGWSHYSAPISPVLSPGAQPVVGATSLYGLAQLSSSTPSLAGSYPSLPSSTGPSRSNQKEQTFPERPGEPECQYYLRTGDCKFESSCRYHHPRDRVVPRTNCALNPMGLPLRPGVQPCSFYLQNGHCKFGSTCKFDHPVGTIRFSPSASSLIDMPVAPYQVGSLLATLAPSSSSDLRPELISGPKEDSYLSRIPSSASTSSSSVGLIFSLTGSVPLSDLQFSSQSAVPLSSSRSIRHGGEVRRTN